MTRSDRLAGASDHTKRVEITANAHDYTKRVELPTSTHAYATRPERLASAPDTPGVSTANMHAYATRPEQVASAPDPPTSANAMARPPRARRRKNGGVRGPFRGPRT